MGAQHSAFAASSAELKGRLDAVERELEAHKPVGRVDVELLGRLAQELRSAAGDAFAAGARDPRVLRRIEILSEGILTRLLSEVTEVEVRKEDFSVRFLELREVAATLDAVRATKASVTLDHVAESLQRRMGAREEGSAKPEIEKLKEIFREIKGPVDVLPHCKPILDQVQKSHEAAPHSKWCTDLLLRSCIDLASKILRADSAWCTSPTEAQRALEAAMKLDEIAMKLVRVMKVAWDPPLEPQVRRRIEGNAEALCVPHLEDAEKELAGGKPGAAYDHLVVVGEWWGTLLDPGALMLHAVGVFSKVQTLVVEDFLKAQKAGSEEDAAQIKAFAEKFDDLRRRFAGFPPAADKALLEILSLSEARAGAEKQLDALEKELAKTCDSDAKTNLSLAATIQALESLASVWPKLEEAPDGDLARRVEGVCGRIEAWASERAAAAVQGTTRVAGLLKFGEEYDKRRRRLPPAPTGGELQPRIGKQVAQKHVELAKAELAKAKPSHRVWLGALQVLATAVPGDGSDGEVLEAATAVFSDTEGRIVQDYREAMLAGEAMRAQEFVHLADAFDRLGGNASFVWSLDTASLCQRLEAERSRLERELVARVEEAGRADEPDFQAVKEAVARLAALGPVCSAPFVEAFSAVGEKLQAACAVAAEAGDPEAARSLLVVAGEMDAAAAALLDGGTEGAGPAAAAAPPPPMPLRPPLVDTVAGGHVARAERIFSSPGTLDCSAVAAELRAAAALVEEGGGGGSSQQLRSRLHDVASSLEGPVTALAIGDAAEGLEPVLELAAAADEARRAAAAGAHEAGVHLRRRVEALQAIAAKLSALHAELSKEKGMNPNTVLQLFNALEPLWRRAEASEALDGLSAKLQACLEMCLKKIVVACNKAVATGDPKKVDALMHLVRDADRAQEALARANPAMDVRRFDVASAHAVTDARLTEIEAELDKETGMNSSSLLKYLADIGHFWGGLARGEPRCAAVDHGEAAPLKGRIEAVQARVQDRMVDAYKKAFARKIDDKVKALLRFAASWDEACARLPLAGLGLNPGAFCHLKESLELAPKTDLF